MTTTLAARVAELAQLAADRAEQRRRENRERWPQIAAFVDELERHFGPGLRVRCVRDEATGETVGRPGPRGVAVSIRRRKV